MPETLEQRLNAADQRVIREEAISALTAANAISPRIAEIFLEDVDVKIDSKTGAISGIYEGLPAWKAAHPDFFSKPAQAVTTKTAAKIEQKPAGVELPSLRGLSARDRRIAVEAYRASLRRASRGGDSGPQYQG